MTELTRIVKKYMNDLNNMLSKILLKLNLLWMLCVLKLSMKSSIISSDRKLVFFDLFDFDHFGLKMFN